MHPQDEEGLVKDLESFGVSFLQGGEGRVPFYTLP